MGPSNVYEEMIEWTKQGKMWPYPLDNEWRIDEKESERYEPERNV